MTLNDSIVSFKDVGKVYRIGEISVNALRNVSLKINTGEFVVILGPSGSGKTTMLNLIGGIDSATSGEIIVADNRVDRLNEKELTAYRRRNIGFIFQFFNLIPTLTAAENVDLALELSDERKSTTSLDILEQVGRKERADHFPNQLSGGEQQRVAIARALAKHAPVMLCDEPTGELDFETGIKILTLLKQLNRTKKQTFILVTHNAVIGNIADRVIKLRSGQIIEDNLNNSIIEPEKLKW
ncbi:MAG TPA: ABC transporter ATP-binding protein [Actinobacteria bacterium]|nr:ABC transporter ATP-binding protein [Actinomycetes bacterium]HEX21140.1 ABC transporter ATP-binding protein [Actinomycetota bacterium]